MTPGSGMSPAYVVPIGAVPPVQAEGVNPLVRVRIEKAASDSGYELSSTWAGDTGTLRSVQFPESVCVQYLGADEFFVSASNLLVLPQGAPHGVSGWAALYEVLGKVSATARTLPDRVAQQFIKQTATLPKSTEAELWVVQRVGQDLFRTALLDYWQGKCCVTGLAIPTLLRASHIRPWSECETDEQRLDVFNGLLLSPSLDALFDDGWITFTDAGECTTSSLLRTEHLSALGFSMPSQINGLHEHHRPYLAYHRENVFRH